MHHRRWLHHAGRPDDVRGGDLFDASAILAADTEIVLRLDAALIGGLAVPLDRHFHVLRNTMAVAAKSKATTRARYSIEGQFSIHYYRNIRAHRGQSITLRRTHSIGAKLIIINNKLRRTHSIAPN